MKKLMLFIVTIFIVILFSFNIGIAENNSRNHKRIQKPSSTQIYYSRIDINNLNALESNIGFSDYNLNSNLEGLEFPRGSGKNAVFEAGFLWGGYVPGDPQVRVGGSTYLSGLEPGPILSNGQPADPSDSKWSIYSVRPDIYPGGPSVDLSDEIAAYAEGGQTVTGASLRSQYEYNWINWPAAGTSNDLGAPFQDVNKDGKYEPNIDIPGVPGADQTNYFVANDEDSILTAGLYGTQPLGIEVHATFWAYNQGGSLNNVYFKKYTLINKGYQHYQIDSMFISFWDDPDLGYAGDDLVGTDSLLNLIYTYNGSPVDAIYSTSPPAVGFHLLEGSVVPGTNNDTAFFNGRTIFGKKNLPMTASYFYLNGDTNFRDPPQGISTGADEFYNFFNGQFGKSDQPYTDPNSGKITKFIFPGDPVTGNGWIESQQFQPADIRQGMALGPFNFAPGDTQEIVFAEILANPDPYPASYLTSINNLRGNINFINSVYYNGNAVKITCKKIIDVNKKDQLSADIFPKSGQLSSISWILTGKPANSNTVIVNSSSINPAFTPDLQGNYNIKLTLKINGILNSDEITVAAVNNKPPVSIFKADTNEILTTDSLLLDYSSSYDPEGDSINYHLSGNGSFRFIPGTKTAYYYPRPGFLGYDNIVLSVSDKYSLDSSFIKVKVDPLLINTKINYSFLDTSWHLNGMLYFTGTDSLYVPLLNSLRRYQITNSGITFKEELNNLRLTGIWTIKNNLLFGSTNSTSGFFGTIGDISIFNLNNGNNSILTNYRPGTADVCNFYQFGNFIYLRDGQGYIYKADFSNPSSPKILEENQLQFIPYSVMFLKYNNQYLYLLGESYNNYSYYIKILDKNYLSTVDSIKMPFDYSYSFAIHDSIITAYSYLSDSLSFYYYDGEANPSLLKKIDCSSLFPNPYPHFNISPYYSIRFTDKYLQLSSWDYGTALFDISDLTNIKLVAACYGGNMNFIKQGSNFFLNVENPLYANINNPYSGINKVTINDITNINHKGKNNVPLNYSLTQNYPNPFNPTTTISFDLPKGSKVQLKIFNILGEEVKDLINEEKTAGHYEYHWNASGLASGVYFYRLKAGDFVSTKKLILLK